jgi:hypothetical protein
MLYVQEFILTLLHTHTHPYTHVQGYLFVTVMISEGHDLMNLIIQSMSLAFLPSTLWLCSALPTLPAKR